jgi:hypothetical protein
MHLRLSIILCLTLLPAVPPAAAHGTPPYGIHVVDAATGRGIPLVELRTVNDQTFLTDNAGWIAFNEPGLIDCEVWFHLTSPGYSREKDGFGFTGVRLTPAAGGKTEIKLQRTQPAERLARLTGQGLYRDSTLLGLPAPLPNLHPAGILGQDSVQAVPWKGRLFWLWGDTSVAHYPLGNFRTTAATTAADIKPESPIAFDYFLHPDKPGTPRPMMLLEGPGAVWLFGLLNVKDAAGAEQLLCHYGRYPGLAPVLEQGIAAFDESAGVFRSVTVIDNAEKWRFPRNHAVRVTGGGSDHFYFTAPLPCVRVRASVEDVKNPASYEALVWDSTASAWQWQRSAPPTSQKEEAALIATGKMPADKARWQLRDAATGKPVSVHTSSLQWNAWRQRWVLIFCQGGEKDAPSYLGEIWYAESPAPDGPWSAAVKVASHPRYSFYNPIHHGFLNAEGGRVIYFEGTYTAEFSGNPVKTPRYDYNQLLYRLDLDAPALRPARTSP